MIKQLIPQLIKHDPEMLDLETQSKSKKKQRLTVETGNIQSNSSSRLGQNNFYNFESQSQGSMSKVQK